MVDEFDELEETHKSAIFKILCMNIHNEAWSSSRKKMGGEETKIAILQVVDEDSAHSMIMFEAYIHQKVLQSLRSAEKRERASWTTIIFIPLFVHYHSRGFQLDRWLLQ